ncbi:hypothetical protein PRZ48_005831 [Zasmidium cellare]|uniref:BTB domain-containing protein n=1 Tax=Zasmidium cellare TaxID=395010 RepID=A0ABR0EMA2_ZASCE|nr:hypothetical protein PRZ48_005831 [Zasmidium cellare]
MPDLTAHQFCELLKTETITLLVGPDQKKEAVQLQKGFAVYNSEFFAGLVSKPSFSGTIELVDVGVAAVKSFVRWCYGRPLKAPNLEEITPEQALDYKHALIDLWIFGEMHVVPRLQNQTMALLRALFSHDYTLLTLEDLEIVFKKTYGAENPLRQLLVLVLVAKVDIGKEETEEYDAIAQAHSGFFAKFCAYQKMWLQAVGKVKDKEKPQKLVEMLGHDDVRTKLRVPAPPPPDWVLVLSGAKAQPQEPGESHCFVASMDAQQDTDTKMAMSVMYEALQRRESSPVTIQVGTGEEMKEFFVPRAILSHASEWFRSALEGDRFPEAREGKVTLAHVSPDVFAAFIYYAYHDHLAFAPNPDPTARDAQLHLCCKLWTFGDEHVMPRLQNSATKRICDLFRASDGGLERPVSTDALAASFQAVREDSPLRLVIADYISNEMAKQTMSLTVPPILAACGGIFAQLQASEIALHTLPAGDFPRFNKPLKFAGILYVEPSNFERRKMESMEQPEASGWNQSRMHCEECGDFLSRANSEKVVIKVGQGERRFTAPKDLLCERSKWFENALKADRFIEGQTRVVELPEDDPNAVEAFIYFIYNQSLVFTDHSDEERRREEVKLCFGIWSFGDKYILPELQNCAMHRACTILDDSGYKRRLDPETLRHCFELSSEAKSPLRVLIADYYVFWMESCSNDLQIDPGLASDPGFLAALHTSEATFHTSPHEFPRYLRPTRFAKLLHVGIEQKSDSSLCQYEDTWEKPPAYCNDCGYTSAIKPCCKHCQKAKCSCPVPDWSFLCQECHPDW